MAGPTGLVNSPTGPREHQGVTGVRLINQPYPAEVIPLLKKIENIIMEGLVKG